MNCYQAACKINREFLGGGWGVVWGRSKVQELGWCGSESAGAAICFEGAFFEAAYEAGEWFLANSSDFPGIYAEPATSWLLNIYKE